MRIPRAISFAVMGLILQSMPVQAEMRAQVFGLIGPIDTVELPSRICARRGQVLRMRADLMGGGDAVPTPATQFKWTASSPKKTIEWDVSQSRAKGPFRRGTEPNSIYFKVPHLQSGSITLRVSSSDAVPTEFEVVNPQAVEDPNCEWAHSRVYIRARFEDIIECGNDCAKGAKCSDGCPIGAMCRYVPPKDLYDDAYWEVVVCPWPPKGGGRECGDECRVGDRCTDGCPRGALCSTFTHQDRLVWEVNACPWP